MSWFGSWAQDLCVKNWKVTRASCTRWHSTRTQPCSHQVRGSHMTTEQDAWHVFTQEAWMARSRYGKCWRMAPKTTILQGKRLALNSLFLFHSSSSLQRGSSHFFQHPCNVHTIPAIQQEGHSTRRWGSNTVVTFREIMWKRQHLHLVNYYTWIFFN